jgi:hypothetical protein
MKKNLLSLAVAATAVGVATSASAQMYLNEEGTGEALVFPFYSTQSGNDTLISIVNTTAQYKAVKVRMIESVDSLETLDFNLYMSPQDHFSFALTAEGDGAKIVTNDNSCTVPAIPEAGQPLSTLLWAADATAPTAAESARTTLGYIEVIEMGQIDDDDAGDGAAIAADILHAATGVPTDCPAVVALWTDTGVAATRGAWYVDADAQNVGETDDDGNFTFTASVGTTGMEDDWAGGGLYGVGTVVNVAEGTAFGYDAKAIDDLVEADATGSVLHYPPGDTRPDFADDAMADTAFVTVDGAQATYDGREIVAPYEAVSALFMTGSISNDYVVDSDINALTDWVLNFPTKSAHLTTVGDAIVLAAPFSNSFGAAATDLTARCQPVSVTGYDREEQTQTPPAPGTDGPAFSPSQRPDPTQTPDLLICNETTVAHFGSASATNTTDAIENSLANVSAFVDGWAAGWAVMDMTADNLNNAVDNARVLTGTMTRVDGGAALNDGLEGLPVTGFAVVEYTNGVADANVRNYQMAWEHKTDVITS